MGNDATADPRVDLDRDLQALTKQLEAVQAKEGAPSNGPPAIAAADQTLFGYTPGALFLGLLVSTVGIACIRYAKTSSRIGPLLAGVAFFAAAFFIKDAWYLLGASGGIAAAALLVRRFVSF
ncbi:MAG: hypothetical protein HYS27_17690 [Deltaproteobacteria bacterium]|nr:hypothetical protein [Deltaproteobacteria bacterium]